MNSRCTAAAAGGVDSRSSGGVDGRGLATYRHHHPEHFIIIFTTKFTTRTQLLAVEAPLTQIRPSSLPDDDDDEDDDELNYLTTPVATLRMLLLNEPVIQNAMLMILAHRMLLEIDCRRLAQIEAN